MHGNVLEWCSDAYSRYDDKPTEPTIVDAGARIVRGGSWSSPARDVRSSNRDLADPRNRYGGVGVRPAMPVTPD
jgi:formylglycine-generating enzyme required for sulfatase activity